MGFEISPQYTQNYIPRNVLESTLTKDIYILVVQLETQKYHFYTPCSHKYNGLEFMQFCLPV